MPHPQADELRERMLEAARLHHKIMTPEAPPAPEPTPMPPPVPPVTG